MRNRSLIALLGALLVCTSPRLAQAFCGFYVSGADAKLSNNATLVVLLREGTLTVLSMQNNYQGLLKASAPPPSDTPVVDREKPRASGCLGCRIGEAGQNDAQLLLGLLLALRLRRSGAMQRRS